jgi:hypothetical protein
VGWVEILGLLRGGVEVDGGGEEKREGAGVACAKLT